MKAACFRSAVVLFAVAAAACDGTTTVTAKVAAADGGPMAGADVKVENALRPIGCTTDAAGACELTFLHGGWYNRYQISISKSGFRDIRRREWAGRRLQCRAVLEPAGATASSNAVCE
jgi:hypothetical protein